MVSCYLHKGLEFSQVIYIYLDECAQAPSRMEPYLLGNPGVLTRPFILLNVCMQRDVNTFSVPNFIGYFILCTGLLVFFLFVIPD